MLLSVVLKESCFNCSSFHYTYSFYQAAFLSHRCPDKWYWAPLSTLWLVSLCQEKAGRKCLPAEKPSSPRELILGLWNEFIQLKWRQIMAFICKMVPSEYLIGESQKIGSVECQFLTAGMVFCFFCFCFLPVLCAYWWPVSGLTSNADVSILWVTRFKLMP